MLKADYHEIQYLRNIPIFAELTDQQLQEIHAKTIERPYSKSSTIFFEGDPGEGFYYVQAGKVKIIKTSDDGREHIINILGPGELFAEVLLFHDAAYPATAIAVEDSRIGVIRNSELEKLVMQNNLLALHLIRALSRRLLFAQGKIKNLALSDVRTRTAAVLLRLLEQQKSGNATNNVALKLDFSRQDLAALVGTTRETVTRTLSALKKDNIIDIDGHRITILDLEALKTLIS